MAKYLQMDGVDDKLIAPIMTATEFEIVFKPRPQAWEQYINFGGKNINTNGTVTADQFHADYQTVYINGASVANNTKFITNNTKQALKGVLKSGISINAATNVYWNGASSYTEGDIYSLKIWNGTTLQAHYDMSTGTIQDQSGNGRHATLTGGTWLDDGTGGTPTGTDGTTAFDIRQSIYQDSNFSADARFSLYVDGATQADIKNILYQDGSTSSDTNQVLYQISSTSFDMLQEIFNDGQVGQTPFDMRFSLYSDGSILHDSRQTMYESEQNAFDLKQAIYESGEGKSDIHLVLFADSSTHHDLIQSLYEDAVLHFDTKQILFSPDQQKIGTIQLKGKRDLYVYLVAKQDLHVPLKAKRELTVSLKGGVNMTMQNQNFSMCAGDTKYIIFPIEGADDLTGATITWGARQRSYSSVDNLLTKSTANGITVEGSEVKIKLDPEDTELLSGTYHHECQLEDNLQNVSTVFTGLMTVNKSAV